MGLSFLSLLYLQIKYIEDVIKMRNEQFDESVKRALMAASKDVESEEVERWLREDISEAERRAWEQSQNNNVVQTQRFKLTSPDGKSSLELKTFIKQPPKLHRAMISRDHGAKTIPQTSRSIADMIKNRYLYQRALVDEVIWNGPTLPSWVQYFRANYHHNWSSDYVPYCVYGNTYFGGFAE